MKIRLLFIISLLSICTYIISQNGVSAEVIFTMSYKGITPDELLEMPKKVTYLVSGSNTKQIVVTPNSTMYVIANGDSVFLANLNDIEDDRVGTFYYADDIVESTAIFDIKIKPTRDMKTILGYPCKKYVVKIHNKETNEKMKDIVYTTEKIGGENVNFLLYKGLKGFILSSEKTNGKEITTMTAKKVLKKDIPPSAFLVPEEYIITTYKEQINLDK